MPKTKQPKRQPTMQEDLRAAIEVVQAAALESARRMDVDECLRLTSLASRLHFAAQSNDV